MLYCNPEQHTLQSLSFQVDEVNVMFLVDQWNENHPNNFTFYRPRTEGPVHLSGIDDEDEDDIGYQTPHRIKTNKNSLLFIHQSATQKALLKRYGSMVLMDATYRTCRLALPLFMLAVKTNVAYIPIAIFIVETEDIESIQEPLRILKGEWEKAGIRVPNFMVDFCQAEITAIETVFPQSTVFLCDFHRGQAWSRWLRTKKHGCSSDYNEIMSYLKRMASATTLTEYNQIFDEFTESEPYQDRDMLRSYFSRWDKMREVRNTCICCGIPCKLPHIIKLLCHSQRWVLAFRTGLGLYDRTNNGLERLNFLLKCSFLNMRVNNTLSDLIDILMRVFIPTLIKM